MHCSSYIISFTSLFAHVFMPQLGCNMYCETVAGLGMMYGWMHACVVCAAFACMPVILQTLPSALFSVRFGGQGLLSLCLLAIYYGLQSHVLGPQSVVHPKAASFCLNVSGNGCLCCATIIVQRRLPGGRGMAKSKSKWSSSSDGSCCAGSSGEH